MESKKNTRVNEEAKTPITDEQAANVSGGVVITTQKIVTEMGGKDVCVGVELGKPVEADAATLFRIPGGNLQMTNGVQHAVVSDMNLKPGETVNLMGASGEDKLTKM